MSSVNSRLGFDSEVRIARSDERGSVCGIAFYKRAPSPMYFVEYVTPDGRAVEGWFHDDELVEVTRGE